MNIIEAMQQRRSVRSFDGQPLADGLRTELLEAIIRIYNPFGGHFTVRLKSFDLKNGYKPTTYGMVKGANDFFMLGIAGDETSALAAGFGFEQIVLQSWQLGLGTCWIAATFKGTDFDDGEAWPDGETLKIVCPVGVAAKKSVMERIARLAVGSHNRKPFDRIFFAAGLHEPLSPTGRFGEALNMLRLAPSSTNSQPWRAIVEGNKVHFYDAAKSPLSVLDCGIGLCHFYETERFNGCTGTFSKDSTAVPPSRENWKYLITYTAEN